MMEKGVGEGEGAGDYDRGYYEEMVMEAARTIFRGM
jgi:hypothetical protein